MTTKTFCDYCGDEIKEGQTQLHIMVRRNMFEGSSSRDIHRKCFLQKMKGYDTVRMLGRIEHEAKESEKE